MPSPDSRGSTDLGGFLDIVLDFIVYAGMVFAFAVADPGANALAAAFLLFAFMGTGSSFLAFAMMAAKRRLSTDLRGREVDLLIWAGWPKGRRPSCSSCWPACCPTCSRLWPSSSPACAG